jgi:GNAT superfamily N-acetyltransferase
MVAKIRHALAQDAEDLARIHRSAIKAAMPWLPRLHTTEEDLRFFADRVLPTETILVVEVEGSIAGFISFVNGWINHLYITPNKLGCGYGSALLGRTMAACESLQLWTFQDNHAARRFYAKHGFLEAEFTDGQRNEEKTPDVRMAWPSII